MDRWHLLWHFSNMTASDAIPAYALYGERNVFPDILHAETIVDRAARHDWRIAPHRHGALSQIFLLEAGEARITVDGAEATLDLPVMLFVPRGVVHGFTFAQGTKGHVITLPDRAFPEVFGAASPPGPRLASWLHVPPDAAMRTAVSTIAGEHGGNAALRDTMLRAQVLALAASLARAAPMSARPDRNRAAAHLDAFEALIRTHLRDRWRIADYAAAMGLTPQQLTRVTRARVGRSASQHLEAHLFREAQRMLAYTRMSVAEAGYRLGFEDPAYFSRAFRRHTGQTPTAYRDSVDPG